VVFAVLVPWRLATSFVAVERALEVGRAKSAVALLLGVGCGLALVELGTVTLLNVLARANFGEFPFPVLRGRE
jgi:hypothetical protein